MVRALGDGEDVRRHLVATLVAVDANGSLSVDGEAFVRIDGNAEEAGVCLEEATRR